MVRGMPIGSALPTQWQTRLHRPTMDLGWAVATCNKVSHALRAITKAQCPTILVTQFPSITNNKSGGLKTIGSPSRNFSRAIQIACAGGLLYPNDSNSGRH